MLKNYVAYYHTFAWSVVKCSISEENVTKYKTLQQIHSVHFLIIAFHFDMLLQCSGDCVSYNVGNDGERLMFAIYKYGEKYFFYVVFQQRFYGVE